MSKVFIVGVDGFSFDLINQWKNELPNLSKLIKEGTSGYLRPTIPMLSPPSWTSMVTGKNPGKHNIFDFFKIKGDKKEALTSFDRKTEAIWDILSMINKKSIILDLSTTYPPQPLNGIMICGAETPSINSSFTYPHSFRDIIFKLNPDYKTGVTLRNLEYKKYDGFLQDLYNVTRMHKELILYLIENEEFDLFFTVFEDADRLEHYLWRYMDQKNPFYIKGNKYENAIKDYYKELDKILGEIIVKLSKDTTLFIVSDHGFGPIYKQIFINNFLLEKGYLKLKNENKNLNLKNLLIKIAYKLKVKHLIQKIPNKLRARLKKLVPSGSQSFSNIDWNNTKVYFNSFSGQYLSVNLKNRDQNGIVSQDEYKGLLENLKKELLEINDDGKKVIKKVYFADEIYHGENLKNAPDLFIITEDDYVLQEGFGPKMIQELLDRCGDHRDNGVLIIKGNNVKESFKLEASVCDIVPTALKILKVPIPEDIDGKIIKCFN